MWCRIRNVLAFSLVATFCPWESAVADYSATIGLNFIDNYSQANAAFLIVSLKPFEERPGASQSAQALIASLVGKLRQVRGGRGVPLAPPPIIGLGTGGGFSYVLQDTGGGSPQSLAQVLRGLLVAANQDPRLSRVFSTFSAATPSVYLDIDRDKAQILKVEPSAIFQALQASLGGYYVNDMNLFGRTWQVQVQAEAEDRASVDDIYRINVRSADDKMIPLRSLVEVKPVIGPQALIRYNNQIVEFAKERRSEGIPLLEAATEGARLRFRPVMMTSFAFILGLLPLVIAVGPSQLARRNVGTPVFGGMLTASFIGIFAIPALYVTVQAIRERLRASARPKERTAAHEGGVGAAEHVPGPVR